MPAETLVILFCISTAVAIAVRRLQVPFTVALVLVGLALGAFRFIEPPHLTKALLFTIFLPGLLFEAAFHLELAAFARVWKSVVALAVPGVIVAIGVMAAIIVLIGRVVNEPDVFTWQFGILLGAIVAATDPVAVTAVFREVRVAPRLGALIEGESLLNDGTGVVFFSLALTYVSGQAATPGRLALEFVTVGIGGALIGVLAGVLASEVIRRIDDPMIEIALTTIAAYGPFVLAEHLGASGVLATVVSGALCGREGRDRRAMSDRSRLAAESFWQYIAFALNSIIFLLIGFELDFARVRSVLPAIVIAFIAMLVARTVIVWLTLEVQRRGTDPLPSSWTVVVIWGGLRGALSMVLALALPLATPNRDLIVATTTGLVVLSILLQGASMPLLVRRLSAEPSA